ncbi:MAG: MATE family efflux transporter [Porcipelethomonas sp.]
MIKNKEIYKRALALAVPMMIQNGITNMVGLIDNIMVGSLGTEAMTAVSIVGQLIFVFNLAIFGGLSGPGIYGAQYYGKGNTEGFRNTFRIKHWICGFCLVFGLLIFIFCGESLIGLYLHGESETIDRALTMNYAKQYLQIMLAGLFPFVLTQIYASSLRETGDSVKPMTAGIISVAIDIIFNYLLIYGHFGVPKLGVRGAAAATVLARIVEMFVVVIWAHIRSDKHIFLKSVYKTFIVPKEITAKIIKKGMPIFFNEFLWAGGLAALTQCYSSRGLEIVAGLNISNAICNLLNVVFVALGSAVGILTGQTLGASQYEKAQKDSFCLMRFTGTICIILTVILISVSGFFPKLYDTTDTVRSYGQWFITITALFFPVQGFLNALYFTLRSGGKTFITFLFDSVYSWLIPIPAALLLCYLTNLPILGIYAIIQSADIIKLIVGYILIKKGIWISNLVSESADNV